MSGQIDYGSFIERNPFTLLEDSLREKNEALTKENEKLKNKLNSLITDKISVLTPIAAVYCERYEHFEEVTECQKCQYHKSVTIGEQTDGSLYGKVFCAYKNAEHKGMW